MIRMLREAFGERLIIHPRADGNRICRGTIGKSHAVERHPSKSHPLSGLLPPPMVAEPVVSAHWRH